MFFVSRAVKKKVGFFYNQEYRIDDGLEEGLSRVKQIKTFVLIEDKYSSE